MEADASAMYTVMMLRVEAHNMTAEELDALKRDHNLVDHPGVMTLVRARKVDGTIIWSMRRMQKNAWETLQAERKKAEMTERCTA